MAEVADRLFVYGTLMPDEPRWPVLQPYATGWEPVTARGHVWDTGSGYPAVRFDPEGSDVTGFLVALDPERGAEAIEVLDRIEGEGVLYRRVRVTTSAGPAIGYEWLGSTEGLVRLASGWPRTA